MKRFAVILMALLLSVVLVACENRSADVVSENLSKAADEFEIQRRVVFYNGITGEYILVLEGLCSLGNYDSSGELSVTCKTGEEEYKKHFLGLSDNVTYFAEQLEGEFASAFHYRVIFKPQTIVPDVDFKGSTEDVPTEQDG